MGLVSQVETELERMLALGLLPADGKFPSEHGLARCFGVSRGTVREAIRSLSTRGLVVQHPGRRSRVVPWDEALTLETLNVALMDSGRLRPGRLQLLEGFLALKREITVELLVACCERASPADLDQLSQACYALMDAARWDAGDGKWVQQEFSLLRLAACAVDRVGHVLLIQSLERTFQGMAQWMLPHLDTQAVQQWAWRAMQALFEKNVQALRQELPPLLEAVDERLLSSLAPAPQPAAKSESHPTADEPLPGEPLAPEVSTEGVPERVVPNLSNSRTRSCDVPPTGASPSEPVAVDTCPTSEPAAAREHTQPHCPLPLLPGRRLPGTPQQVPETPARQCALPCAKPSVVASPEHHEPGESFSPGPLPEGGGGLPPRGG
jgi:DNA-binding FadR family transcriptional regulator